MQEFDAMAHKTVEEKLAELTKQADRFSQQVEHLNKITTDCMNELMRVKQFHDLGKDVYIDTTLGKGTVLAMIKQGKDTVAKCFIGQGESAKIVNIRHWQFIGKV